MDSKSALIYLLSVILAAISGYMFAERKCKRRMRRRAAPRPLISITKNGAAEPKAPAAPKESKVPKNIRELVPMKLQLPLKKAATEPQPNGTVAGQPAETQSRVAQYMIQKGL